MSGKRQTQQTSHNERQNINTGPWGPQQPFVQHGFGEARRLYDQGPMQYFPGPTYVDPSRYTMQGIHGLANMSPVQSDPLYQLGSMFMGQSLGSVPQIGHIQDFIGAQLNPNTQMRPPVPGYAPEPSDGFQGPQIPGGGGGPMASTGIQQIASQIPHGGKPAFSQAPGGAPIASSGGGSPMASSGGGMRGMPPPMARPKGDRTPMASRLNLSGKGKIPIALMRGGRRRK